MKIPPLSVLQSWPKPNYVDPVTRGPEMYIITGIFLAIATLALGTRLYARLFVRRWFGLDDVFILLGYVRFNASLASHSKLMNQDWLHWSDCHCGKSYQEIRLGK
jgi:hypothetical protein